MDRSKIDTYESGVDLRPAVDGLSPRDLLWMPPKELNVGLWSIQQILIHLLDSDLVWAFRMKCMISEDHPRMIGFDESKFAANLFYDKQDPQAAMRIMDLHRRQFSKALRKLPDSSFSRTGEHSERGLVTLEQAIDYMIQHIEHHLKFIRLKREKIARA